MEIKNYDEAVRRLEAIVRMIENGEMDIDSLSAKLKEAKELVTYCKDKLLKVEEEVKEIMKNEK